MKIETVRRLSLTQTEKNILEKAMNLCNEIEAESDNFDNWVDSAFNASAAIDDLLGQAEDEEEN